MNDLSSALLEMMDLDSLASKHSPIHDRHPLVKLLVTIAYIFAVVSFPVHTLSALIPLILYPIIISTLSGISLSLCLKRLRLIVVLVCAVGIWNPILDRQPVFTLWGLVITSGWISFFTLMLKGILALLASYLLIATTNIEKICYALRKLHVPAMIVTLILITFRYISLLITEASTMLDAYHLRAPGQKGIHISAWGSFLGQLLLRSMDRAEELYQSMQLRGFSGEFYYAEVIPMQASDLLYMLLWLIFFLLCRFVNLSVFLGKVIL